MSSSSASRGVTSLDPDAPATKRDLNEMAEAIMEAIMGHVDSRFEQVDARFDKMERLLRMMAISMGIPESEVDEALR